MPFLNLSVVMLELRCYLHAAFISPDRPQAPRNLRVTDVYKDFIVVMWDAPESDGGAPVTKYIVEKRDVSRTSYTKAGTVDGDTFTLKVEKLIEGKEYTFQVAAENEIGQSDWTKLDEPVLARLPFGTSNRSICALFFTVFIQFLNCLHSDVIFNLIPFRWFITCVIIHKKNV